MKYKESWIGAPVAYNKNLIYRFRKKVNVTVKNNPYDNNGDSSVIMADICADSRYKLYINGRYVCEGPCIGTLKYYDEADISDFLKNGENEIEAMVFYAGGNTGASCINRGKRVAFCMNAYDEEALLFQTDESWECSPDFSTEFFLSPEIHKNGYLNEKYSEYIPQWNNAVSLNYSNKSDIWGVLPTMDIKPRPIKMYTPSAPVQMKISKTDIDCIESNESEASVKAGEKGQIVFSLDKLSVGYPEFEFYGFGSIVITYAESYSFKNKEYNPSLKTEEPYVKRIRSDSKGDIVGAFDEIVLDGYRKYRSFFTKCFRYIKLDITADSDITVKRADFLEYRYPMNVENDFSCSNEVYNRIFNVSINTLCNCTFDTYVDCPYYEMQQYIEDAYLEMMYTFSITSDYTMPRKAILDIWHSQNYEGMLTAAAPMTYRQITPTFCLFFIMMIDKYLLYTGDKKTVLPMLPSIYSILEWFARYKNADDIVGVYEYGKFIDWVPGWQSGFSVDKSENQPASISNLMYLYALKISSALFEYFGKHGVACDLRNDYEKLKSAVNNTFYNSYSGMYTDTVDGGYSEHSQIWAVLSGAITGSKAEKCLRASCADYVNKCSYSYRYFRNRAYEMLGIEFDMDSFLSDWRKMLSLDATSWFEFPGNTRSDCHGWSSVPIYEFTSTVLGIKPVGIGISTVEISPSFGTLDYAKGSLPTACGQISVEWHRIEESNRYEVCVKSPKSITKIIHDENKNTLSLSDSVITYITK
ncbi:MAG: hypothetical protein SOZ62_02815 [Eubacteriales bacterium]|nr:hypothetical protein [Eubacteriales bacterium]